MNSTPYSNPTKETTQPGTQKADVETAVLSLHKLLEGNQQEQRETFEYLRKSLDEDRPSNRRLFNE
ncbi:MAG: hypothetical protein ACRD4L_09070 [Pyrinomonadaceae bacterium]